ncbi:HEAT repeat domain-containing protein [Streptomyces sp. TLI_171]|uniref:HEAT repeat domain-containing protein n=1 Tax=Streptomyces sp. TLI_171 TaxID=1938859 RepID=UPI000C1A64AE|nr:HEAT repeat domain-containing protein [Streptomyces sp. TLI_171]RKE02921.1 HEAT repeat protein [Streptomyces sp. TLI_171]
MQWFKIWGQGRFAGAGASLLCAVHDEPSTAAALIETAWSQADRVAAVRALGRWANQPGILEALIRLAVDHSEPQVRAAALATIAALPLDASNSATVVTLLQSRATRDPAPGPRRDAVWLLGRDPDNETSRAIVADRALRDPFIAVRGAAVNVLRDTWGIDRHSHIIRRVPAQSPQSTKRWYFPTGTVALDTDELVEKVRKEAPRALNAWRNGNFEPLESLIPMSFGMLRGGPLPAGLAAYQQVFRTWFEQHPADWSMMVEAVEAGPRHPFHAVAAEFVITVSDPLADPGVFDLLIRTATNGQEVHRMTLDGLRRYPADAPHLRDTMLHIATHNRVPAHRRIALEWLLQRRPTGVDYVPFLLERATNEPDTEVRLVARRALALWWPNDPRCAAHFRALAPHEDTVEERWTRFRGLAATGSTDTELLGILETEPDDELRTWMRGVIEPHRESDLLRRTLLASITRAMTRLASSNLMRAGRK